MTNILAAYGLAAFGAPEWAISPTTKTFGSDSSAICNVGRVLINPVLSILCGESSWMIADCAICPVHMI